jgi:hypothetical protein
MGRKEGIKKFLIIWIAFVISILLIVFVGSNGFQFVSVDRAGGLELAVGLGFIALISMVPASMIVSWKWGFKDFWQCQNCKNGNHESCTKPYEPIPYDDGIWHCCCVVDEINKVKTSLDKNALYEIMKWRDRSTEAVPDWGRQGSGKNVWEMQPINKMFFTPPFPSHFTMNKRTCNACKLGKHQECHSPNTQVDEIGNYIFSCCCTKPIDGAMWMQKKQEAVAESNEAFEKWQRALAEGAEERNRQEQADRNSGGSW